MEPVEGGVLNANGGKSIEEYGVGDGVKGHTQIKQDEDGEEFRVSYHEEGISDLDEGHFSTMEGAETRLELFIQIVVGMERRGDNSF